MNSMWDPILKLILPNFVFVGPVNNTRDPLFKCKHKHEFGFQLYPISR